MDNNISRRSVLKYVAAGVAATGVSSCAQLAEQSQSSKAISGIKPVQDNWANTHDRVWLGGEYWANPMEDWRVENGGAECISRGGNRSVHSLTHQLGDFSKPFEISVVIQQLENSTNDGGAGIRLGAKSELNEYRSNCFVQQGFDLGVKKNSLILGDKSAALSDDVANKPISLYLKAIPQLGAMALTLTAKLEATNQVIGQLTHIASIDELRGNVALVSNFALAAVEDKNPSENKLGSRYRFSHWTMQGEAFSVNEQQKFGPILWTMYTLSDTRSEDGFVMNLSALTGPMGEDDNHNITLQINKGGEWTTIATEALDTDAWVATFRVPNWNEKSATEYRVVYLEKQRDGSDKPDVYGGTIQANPVGRKMRMASLTCQNDYAFPYAPVVNNVVNMKPDLVFFSGDQLYESHGGFGVIRAPAGAAILNYLRKFYQFGWAFGEAMRNQPTVCLPDDHDVLQGNLWGEAGAAMPQEALENNHVDKTGGYIEPLQMLNVVHRTHTAHHMAPTDPTPSLRGLSVYYGEMVYGNVGFAIVADRQWKSGPEHLNITVGSSGQDEEPNDYNPAYDHPDLNLLGKRQEAFLEKWSKDWRGHELKALLSQTVFASIATHQWKSDHYLKYDFDSNGWPATARNRAVDAIRDSMALHICGDTHLASISQYGVNKPRDSNWAFCSPAIAVGWQRWWEPDSVGLHYKNRPSHGLENTGEYLDSFGNKNYVYAVGNPIFSTATNRYVEAHEKASGFGFITFDTEAKTYTLDAYKFLVDATDGNANNQYSGWPITIHQRENKGENILS